MSSEEVIVCPRCGSQTPVSQVSMTWVYNGKFYCSEQCARTGANNG